MSKSSDAPSELGSNATFWHVEFGAITRVTNEPVRVGSYRFRADEVQTPRISLDYTEEEFAERWEETIFDDPLHAEEVIDDAE